MSIRRTFLFGLAATLLALPAGGCGSETRRPSREELSSAGARHPEDVRTAAFAVAGMTCSGCEVGVVRVLERVPGVVSAEADYRSGQAWCRYDPSQADVGQLVQAIESLGYSAQLLESGG